MKLTILHHHLNPGGVTQVIRNHLQALDLPAEEMAAVHEVLLLHGGRAEGWPPDFERSLQRIKLTIDVVPALDYDSVADHQVSGSELAALLLSRLTAASMAAEETVIQCHNPTLCKNVALVPALWQLARAGYRCLLQVHDFAEDFRPDNLLHLREAWSVSQIPLSHLYPQAAHIHYATLTGRDALVLANAGLPPTQIHRAPNPVIAEVPSCDPKLARGPLQSKFGIPPETRLLLYPVRGIRRKNIGEAVLWAALGSARNAVAITLPPKNPVESASYRLWESFASEHAIPCFFDVGAEGGLDYEENLAAADVLLTTSVAEGFGMVFLEACLRDRPLVGRNLTDITSDFVAEGVQFDGMYDRFRVPLELLDVAFAKASFRSAFDHVRISYGREPLSATAFASAWSRLTSDDGIDFACLDRTSQQNVICRVCGDGAVAEALLKANPCVAAALDPSPFGDRATIANNAAAVRRAFSAKSTGRTLLEALWRVRNSPISAVEGLITHEGVLDAFLAAERFHPIRSEEASESPVVTIIRQRSSELRPIATGTASHLQPLTEVQAVLFDIYGTMLISGSGDVGPSGEEDVQMEISAFQQAWDALELPAPLVSLDTGPQLLVKAIKDHHRRARASGVEFPEVDILDIWSAVLSRMTRVVLNQSRLELFAAQYELGVNPVWPMPDLWETISGLRGQDVILGIVSNAQFFTPAIFPALVDHTLEQLGFRPNLMFFSYRYGRAKPGADMFDQAVGALDKFGIPPKKALYVGNDMRNDVMPAGRAGMRTALFAGDKRSLRMRVSDPSVQGVQPDVVVTELRQLLDCLNH